MKPKKFNTVVHFSKMYQKHQMQNVSHKLFPLLLLKHTFGSGKLAKVGAKMWTTIAKK